MKRRNFLKLVSASLVIPSLDFSQESTPKTELHLWTNDTDYIIAHDEEDAKSLLIDMMYGDTSSESEYEDDEDWHQFDDDTEFTLYDIDNYQEETKGYPKEIKKAREWVEECGRCYFACTEW
jgi:hypothetical protein